MYIYLCFRLLAGNTTTVAGHIFQEVSVSIILLSDFTALYKK